MKKLLFLFFGMFFTQLVAAQDLAPQGKLSIEAIDEKPEISIYLPELSLSSFYKNDIFTKKIELTEVDFSDKQYKRSLDLMAMMEAERAYRDRLASNSFRLPEVSGKDHSVFSIGNTVQLYSRASNYDWFTGETKNPAYRELQTGFLKPEFYGNFERNYFHPYSPSRYNYFFK